MKSHGTLGKMSRVRNAAQGLRWNPTRTTAVQTLPIVKGEYCLKTEQLHAAIKMSFIKSTLLSRLSNNSLEEHYFTNTDRDLLPVVEKVDQQIRKVLQNYCKMLLPETFSFYFSVGTFWTLIASISRENKTFRVLLCLCRSF